MGAAAGAQELEVDARWRSIRASALVTLACALVAIGPHLPGATRVIGAVSGAQAASVAGLVWGVFVLATIAFHALGPRHGLSRALSTLDDFVRYGAVLALIFLSGSASSPLWVASMAASYAWSASTPRGARLEVARIVGSHVALIVAFLVARKLGDAWLALLVLLASIIGYMMTARLFAKSARVRAERDVVEQLLRDAMMRRDRERMARELHDGVGADVMALVLRLRRAAEAGGDPHVARLAERARDLLDELRSVVWSLRNEQGTLAELGKLIDASCKRVDPAIRYARTTPIALAKTAIGPRAALAALGRSREMVQAASSRAGVSSVELTLTVGEGLELIVRDDGGGAETRATIAIDAPTH